MKKSKAITSLIPVFLIVSFPGFRDKIWMMNEDTGYWQGIYQWESEDAVKKYKKSFVLGVMNNRSVSDSVSYEVIPNTNLSAYINQHLYEDVTE